MGEWNPSGISLELHINSMEQSLSSEDQLGKQLPAFYGSRKLITVFTIACHLLLSWARSLHSTPQFSSLNIHFNIILPATPRSFAWSLSFIFLHQNLVRTSHFSHTCYMPCPSHSSWFDHPNNIWWGVQIIKLFIRNDLTTVFIFVRWLYCSQFKMKKILVISYHIFGSVDVFRQLCFR